MHLVHMYLLRTYTFSTHAFSGKKLEYAHFSQEKTEILMISFRLNKFLCLIFPISLGFRYRTVASQDSRLAGLKPAQIPGNLSSFILVNWLK